MYFIGNVLSPVDGQPEQDDPTFAFTREEVHNLDLTNTPIRMEHHKDMEVGTVRSSWVADDGSKWIVGKLKNDSLQSIFAKHAISTDEPEQPYYTGLSLQHTHTQFASGATEKKAVEVSLCCDPRRSDCRIKFVSPLNAEVSSGKTPYKTNHFASKMETPTTPATPATPAPTATPATPATPNPEPSSPVDGMDVTTSNKEMMRVIIDQQIALDERDKTIAEQNEKNKKLQAMEEERINRVRSKNEVLAKAVVENWSKQLSQEDMNDASRHSIMELATKYPQETQEFFRVAHHASQKYAAKEEARTHALEHSKDAALKESFNKVMSKQVHAASKKPVEAASATNPHFMDALNKYRVSGSGRDLMERVVDLHKPKRRKFY